MPTLTFPQVLLLLWVALSVLTALCAHPENRAGILAKVLEVLGRLSFLRFGNSPGSALHLPLSAQRRPLGAAFYIGPQSDEAERVLKANGVRYIRLTVLLLVASLGACIPCKPQLVANVSADLDRTDYQSRLSARVSTAGLSAVVCAVEAVIAALTEPEAPAIGSPIRSSLGEMTAAAARHDRRQHAQSWLTTTTARKECRR